MSYSLQPGAMPGAVIASPRTQLSTNNCSTMTYEQSVLDCADEYGCITLKDAKRLFEEHGSDYWEAHKEGMPITLNAEKLLDWLGY